MGYEITRDPYALTPKQLANALDQIKLIKAWCDGVETAAIQVLLSNVKVPNYRLAFNKPHKKWADEEAVKTLCKTAGLRTDAYAPRVLDTPTRVMKLLEETGNAELLKTAGKMVTRNAPKLVVTSEDNTYYDVANAVDIAVWYAMKTADQPFPPT